MENTQLLFVEKDEDGKWYKTKDEMFHVLCRTDNVWMVYQKAEDGMYDYSGFKWHSEIAAIEHIISLRIS